MQEHVRGGRIVKEAARDADAEYLKHLEHELSFRNKNQ